MSASAACALLLASTATAAMLPRKRMTGAFAHTADDRFFSSGFQRNLSTCEEAAKQNSLAWLPYLGAIWMFWIEKKKV
jgi:hypothetical protein